MIIKRIELSNFRNYESLEIDFNNKTNILYGKNAQGKTNLLEAAFLSATTKSHRSAKDKEMIKVGNEEAHITTFVEKDEGDYRIDIHLRSGRAKVISLNRVPLKKASELFGIVQVIFFSPGDLDIVKGGPEMRRRFLDMELCQIDRIYLNDLTEYKKALMQRNKLLKDINDKGINADVLPIWDEKLCQIGCRIIDRRDRFIKDLLPLVNYNYTRIAGSKEELKIFYEPNVSIDEYAKKLEKERRHDIRYGQTTVGPHRDDMGFIIVDMDARKYGSQGQQRSCALSLKLAEIQIMEEKTGQKPVLLLDDVLSELDTDRQRELLNCLNEVQTILTCTGMEEIKNSGMNTGKIFIVNNAQISEA